jgi:molybdopterin converting factor subunit 1
MSAQVRVLYFAAARERTGTAAETLQVAAPVTAGAVLDAVCARHPGFAPLRPHVRVAVDREFVSPEAPVPEGAEVAIIPPVAGGSANFRVQDAPLSLDEVVAQVSGTGFGGVVTFTGAVRDRTSGKAVVKLEYEAYRPMAEEKMASIAAEAQGLWPGTRLAIHHRVGTLRPGELAVVIAAAAPHRDAAFAACRHAIERLKQDVPIWKKETLEDGVVWVGLGP